MPKMNVNCPNCKQPVIADIDQLFDVKEDPSTKQRLLSGMYNLIQCPSCGYQGNLPTPIVYHDPDKELLLTFFPPEMGMPMEEQERIIGPLITRVTNSLPQEQRKAYLFRPQTMLTIQSLIEQVLEADGITKEMIEAQQQRLNLIQRLVNASDEVIEEVANQDDELIDAEFFTLLSRLIEASAVTGDQDAAQGLSELQNKLLPITTYGRELEEQSREVEATIKSLQEIGDELTREKLLELVILADTETKLRVLVSLARTGMDYQFFQLLSERIDRARGDGRTRLIDLRETLLEMTGEYDQEVEARMIRALEMLESIISSNNIPETIQQFIPGIDEFFIRVLEQKLTEARESGDLQRIEKLNQVDEIIQQISETPPEIGFIEELVNAPSEQVMQEILEANKQVITPEFLDMLTTLISRTETEEQVELSERLQVVYKLALRYSMEMNI
jgi:hypothetical protein